MCVETGVSKLSLLRNLCKKTGEYVFGRGAVTRMGSKVESAGLLCSDHLQVFVEVLTKKTGGSNGMARRYGP